MARTWLINSRALARKVKNPTRSAAHQIKDCGANRECPNCHYRIDNSDVSFEWPGLPAGVKFDPSDVEIVEHLAAKCGVGSSKPHMFIDEFIPTLEANQGICYAHPQDLPGAMTDGSSVHFFHRTINAYATGQRKRRKIQSQHSLSDEHVRWHKTGKTKPVIENGVQKGFKKIMVLYKSSKGSKPHKSNWVMHQYHVGTEEDEKEGEYVVSKIFYQQEKQTDKHDDIPIIEDRDTVTLQTSPRTPNPSNPPRPGKSIMCDDIADDGALWSSAQNAEFFTDASHVLPTATMPEDDMGYPAWLAGESQAVESSDLNSIDDSLLCNEILDPSSLSNNSGLNHVSYTSFAQNTFDVMGNNNPPCGISDLENLELDTPPDFQLADLQFGSQDSILGWLDRLSG